MRDNETIRRTLVRIIGDGTEIETLANRDCDARNKGRWIQIALTEGNESGQGVSSFTNLSLSIGVHVPGAEDQELEQLALKIGGSIKENYPRQELGNLEYQGFNFGEKDSIHIKYNIIYW